MAQKFTVPVTIKNLSSAGSDGITVFLDQESFARLKVEAGGRITWGAGAGAGDTNLYRDEANVLKTDDTFKAAGLFVTGTQIDPTGATVGDALVFNGTKFVSASVAGGGGNASLTVSDTIPTGAEQGDLWFESDTGKTFVYYDSFWVEIGNSGGAVVAESITGNAATATTLQTPRAISLSGDLSGSASFNGSSNVAITATIQPNSVALGTDTTGNYINDLTAGTGVTITHTPAEGSSPTVAIGQAVGTSSSVQFASVTAPLIGNASTATTLQNARTIQLTGDVSGSVSFNGSSDASISTIIQPNSVTLGTDTTGNYVSGVSSGIGISVSHTPGEGSTATISLDATLDNLSNVTVPSPTTNDVLQWNGTAWVNVAASTVGATNLDGLSDVVVTTPAEFQTLQYDGTNWVNSYSTVVTYVRNAEATTLTTGTVVYLFGATGDHATVKRADNDSDTTSSKTVGLVAASIASAANGPVVTRGYVDGIDLSVGYASGDVLWLGEDGAFTKTKPTAPEHLVFIGVVVRATNNGIVYVATQNGYELDELHDVSIVSKTAGDFLKYNGILWVNDPINLGTDTVGNYMSDVSAGTGIAVSHTPGEGSTATISIESTAWTSYTPTITADAGGFALNNGTLTGRYKQVGKTVFFKLKFVFGSTTAAGTGHWNFSLPVTAYDSDFTFSAAILDSGIAWYGGIGNGNYTGSTSSFAVIIPGTNASVTTWAAVGNGGPFIWGTADNITITGSYEAA
jgi:hypothetical protein